MALTLVSNGQLSDASQLNQIINVLMQPSGGTETGRYIIAGNIYTNGAFISYYVCSLSRNATPVSASIDTADVSPTNLNAPGTSHLTNGGFQIFASNSSASTSSSAGGHYTINF